MDSTRGRLTLPALLLTAAVALGSLAGVAGAAPKPNWKGKSEHNSTLNMTVKKGKVTRFSVNVRMFCTNGEGFQFAMLYHDEPLKIRNGKFKFEGEDESGRDYEFDGKITGSKAKGTVGYHDSSYNASEQSFTFCNANDVKWNAKKR